MTEKVQENFQKNMIGASFKKRVDDLRKTVEDNKD